MISVDGVLSRVPLSMKIRGALAALGINKGEQDAIDSAIARLGSHPVVATVVGREVTSIGGLIDTTREWAQTAPDKAVSGLPTLRGILGNPQGRLMVAQIAIDAINKSPERERLISALHKFAEAPLPGIQGVTFASEVEFLAEGALPLLANLLPAKASTEDLGVLVDCPYCKERFVHHL